MKHFRRLQLMRKAETGITAHESGLPTLLFGVCTFALPDQ